MDKAVTYLANNQQYMKYDKALEKGWPIATGMIEGACRFVIEDRFGITSARWSPEGAETVLKIRAIVVNGDLDDYMRYYKQRYREERHLSATTRTPSNDSTSPHDRKIRNRAPFRKTHPTRSAGRRFSSPDSLSACKYSEVL